MECRSVKSFLIAITAVFAAVNCAYAQEFSAKAPVILKDVTKTPLLPNGQPPLIPGQIKLIQDVKITPPKAPLKLKVEGGVDSGGGTLVKSANGMGLLDLYVHNRADFYDHSPSVRLSETRSLRKYGIDVLDPQSAIVQNTLRQIVAWEKSSPLLITNLKKALLHLPVFFFDGSFEFVDGSYVLPNELDLPKESLQLAAFYVKNFGVLVSKQEFEMLSGKNQMALLIHEALRHQQISFEQYGLDHSLIQELTAKLVQKPNGSLDSERYLTGSQRWILQAKPQVFSDIQATAKSLCPRFTETCSLINLNSNLDLKTLSQKLDQIVQKINKEANNTTDPQKSSEYQAASNALMNVWQSVISLNLAIEDQEYKEALFDFKGSNALKIYIQRYNAQEPMDSKSAEEFLKIINQFRSSELIKISQGN